MYTDRQLTVSNAQAVTATAVSTNFIDTGNSNPLRDIGRGTDMRMAFIIPDAFVGPGTVRFELVEADDAAGTTNVTVLAASADKTAAQLTAGTMAFDIVIPSNARRFVGARYTVTNGPMTAGSVTATLVHDTDFRRWYASGYPIAY